jgi:hypothetical protein
MIKVKIVVKFFIFYRSLKGDAARSMGKSINQEIREKLNHTLVNFPIVPQKGHVVNLLDFLDDFNLSEEARNYVLEEARRQVDDNLFHREIISVVICNGYLLITC